MSGGEDSVIPHAEMPPYARGLRVSVDGEMDGRAVLIMPWSGRVMGRPGFFHGGAITGLLELAGLVLLRDRLADFFRLFDLLLRSDHKGG